MRAGRLRHRVTIQKNEASRGKFGEVLNNWVDLTTVWAEVQAISGRELVASGAVFSEATVRIWLRYRQRTALPFTERTRRAQLLALWRSSPMRNTLA